MPINLAKTRKHKQKLPDYMTITVRTEEEDDHSYLVIVFDRKSVGFFREELADRTSRKLRGEMSDDRGYLILTVPTGTWKGAFNFRDYSGRNPHIHLPLHKDLVGKYDILSDKEPRVVQEVLYKPELKQIWIKLPDNMIKFAMPLPHRRERV